MTLYKPASVAGSSSQVSPSTAGIANWINAPAGNSPYPGGFDAWSRRNTPNADKKGASGYFSRTDGSQIAVWITEITADFSVSGESGQSRMLREFFPRSFNDVTLNIKGNVASTQEFNRLALFVRETQWLALNPGSKADPTMTFVLNGTSSTNKGFPYTGRNVKGPHRPWQVTGYIQSMQAGAVAHQIAPEFNLGFIVATSVLSGNTGLWSDVAAPTPVLKNILEMLPSNVRNKRTSGFVASPGQKSVGKAVSQAENWAEAAAAAALKALSGF